MFNNLNILFNTFLSCLFWLLFSLAVISQTSKRKSLNLIAQNPKNKFKVALIFMNPFSDRWMTFRNSENAEVVMRYRERAIVEVLLTCMLSLLIALAITFKITDNRLNSLVQQVELHEIMLKNLRNK